MSELSAQHTPIIISVELALAREDGAGFLWLDVASVKAAGAIGIR